MSTCFFGRYLLQKGLLDESQLRAAILLQRERNQSLGDLAVASGVLEREQVIALNGEQSHCDELLGELAVEHQLLSQAQLDELLTRQRLNNLSIGQVLIEMGVFSDKRLSDLLGDYHFWRARQYDECVTELRAYRAPQLAKTFIDELIKAFARICRAPVAMARVHRQVALDDLSFATEVQLLRLDDDSAAQNLAEQRFNFNLLFGASALAWLEDKFSQRQRERLSQREGGVEAGDVALAAELGQLLSMVADKSCERLALRGEHYRSAGSHSVASPAKLLGEQMHGSAAALTVDMASEDRDFQLLLVPA